MFILQKVSAREWVQRHTSSRKKCNSFSSPHHLFTQKTIYVFSKHGRKKFACFLFASYKQWIWLRGKNLWQFCLFSSRLLSWHTPPHEVRDAPPCFTSAQVHKCTSFTSAQVEMSKHPSCEGKRSCKCIANAIYSKVDIFLGKRLILAQNCQMQERIVHQ